MTEVEIKVDNVSKTQTGLVASDKWYNFPKGSSDKFEGINRGDTVALALDDKGNVVEYKVVAKAEKKAYPAKGGSSYGAPRGKTPEEQALIIRQVAVKAVFEGKTLNDLENGFESLQEAVVKIEKYITGGKF